MPKKVFVLFVEPMLYGLDLIREVYSKSSFEMQYYYCHLGLTGRDNLDLPEGAIVGNGSKLQRKKVLIRILDTFMPDFCVINGYTGIDQNIVIRYCIQHKIPYGIDSDTPLHIPSNPLLAVVKKLYLHLLLCHPFCYGIPGGTLQKENFLYYGIPEARIFIRPMTVSQERIRHAYEALPSKSRIKQEFGLDGKSVFLFVGRLETVKNVDILIDAFGKIKVSKPDTALVIIGDGNERDNLEKMVVSNGIPDVYFAGYQVFPALTKYYKLADVFVLPSSFEPWGLVVNEAMICGLPVIVSTKVGCRQDLIAEGKNGYIFESGCPYSLVSVMKKMLDAV